jgi:hypothetical protein
MKDRTFVKQATLVGGGWVETATHRVYEVTFIEQLVCQVGPESSNETDTVVVVGKETSRLKHRGKHRTGSLCQGLFASLASGLVTSRPARIMGGLLPSESKYRLTVCST